MLGRRRGLPGPSGRRILITGINYFPEESGIAPYTTGLAEHLRQIGWDVSVVTGMPHYPRWQVPADYRGRLWTTERINNIEVRRRQHYVPKQQSAVRRGLYEATFLLSGLVAPTPGRPDLVLGVTPSLSGAVIAALTAKRQGVPYALLVQDLLGKAAAQTGIKGGRRAAGAAQAIEARVARGAAGIAIIAEGFRSYLEDVGVEAGRIHRIRNWTHISGPTRSREQVRAELGIPRDAWVCLHAGNMGLKQGLENVIDAARLALASPDSPLFILMGDGNQRQHLERLAVGLPNVRFLPPQPEDDFPNVLAAADVLLINQLPSVVDMCLPGKLTSYLAVARPVVAAVAATSETATELAAAEAGLVIDAGLPDRLLDAVTRLRADRGFAQALGERGRAYALAHLAAAPALANIEHFLTSLISAPATSLESIPGGLPEESPPPFAEVA